MKLSANSKYDLAGVWVLNDYSVKNSAGDDVFLWGDNPEGILIYLDNGYMSVHVSNINRPCFESNDFLGGTVDEIIAAFEGYTAYYGRYELYDDGVIHHYVNQSIYPNWNKVTQKRFVTLNPPKLTLSTPPILINGELCVMQMNWKRID